MSERDAPRDAPERRPAGDADRPVAPRAEPERRDTPITQQIGRLVLLTIAVLFVIFSLVNLQPVEFDWIFGSTDVETVGGNVEGGVPLIVLMLGGFVLGAIVGAGLVWRRGRRRRHAHEREAHQ